jgi:uncharacterized glyoxalase superfamily protein PhnB
VASKAEHIDGKENPRFVVTSLTSETWAAQALYEEKAIKLGASVVMPVMDMFWGDRCGTVADADGNNWWIVTHVAEPTAQEMKKKMTEQVGQAAKATA